MYADLHVPGVQVIVMYENTKLNLKQNVFPLRIYVTFSVVTLTKFVRFAQKSVFLHWKILSESSENLVEIFESLSRGPCYVSAKRSFLVHNLKYWCNTGKKLCTCKEGVYNAVSFSTHIQYLMKKNSVC